MICPACNHSNEADAKFCENCGRPMEHTCPNCGNAVSAGAKFCKHCGHNLAASEATKTNQLDDMRRAVPQTVAEKIRAERSRAEGERKQVTALFTDIVGSTALAEQIDPEDWREIVSGAHQRVSAAVYAYEGTIAQLLGDGVLAFFGAPIAHEDDAERAIRAALEILESIERYADELRRANRVPNFQMRIGLNTGLVVVGNIGSDLHMEYLAVGDTVNLAARIQSAADANSILVSRNTQRLVETLFEFEDRGKIALKGKSEPTQIFRVVGERKDAVRARGVSGLTSALVGRQRELMMLKQVGEDATAGRGAVVSVIAEAGLGKSRLTAEWRKLLLSDIENVCCVEARCLSFTQSVAHHLSAEIVRSITQASSSQNNTETQAALLTTTTRLLGDAPSKQETSDALAHLLGLPLDEDAAQRMKFVEGAAMQAKYLAAFKNLLQAQAREAPTILICEDTHWADPSSVEMISSAISISANAPIVFVFVTRPDADSAGWRLVEQSRMLGVGSVELHLAPLNERDSEALLSNLLNIDALPDLARQRILAKSEGNPFFVEEVIRMLIERGVIVKTDDGRWQVVGDIGKIDIPDTLQGVLTARIDRLPEDTKRLLQIASVIGRRFSIEVLKQVVSK
jgi:class 3 adenylate cyclase